MNICKESASKNRVTTNGISFYDSNQFVRILGLEHKTTERLPKRDLRKYLHKANQSNSRDSKVAACICYWHL